MTTFSESGKVYSLVLSLLSRASAASPRYWICRAHHAAFCMPITATLRQRLAGLSAYVRPPAGRLCCRRLFCVGRERTLRLCVVQHSTGAPGVRPRAGLCRRRNAPVGCRGKFNSVARHRAAVRHAAAERQQQRRSTLATGAAGRRPSILGC